MSYRIPLSSPDITEAEIEAVTAVLRTNTLSLGPKLAEFEDVFAAFHHMPHAAFHAIGVSSGTAALHLALIALDICPGDEVIVPSFTFIAVANAVRYVGATPVFADIDEITLNLDPASVASVITLGTKAIIVVHTFGAPANMEPLMSLARFHHLAVIEDACEAVGATYNNQLVGTFGDISTFAFYPNKQMTTGEGGMLLTRDAQLAARLRALRNQGRCPSDDWLRHSELGFNYRLSELACALGIVQTKRLPAILSARTRVAEMYDAILATVGFIERPLLTLPGVTISWFVYVIRLKAQLTATDRDRLMQALHKGGIASARYFAPIHLQPAYAEISRVTRPILPVTESVSQRTLALPFFNRLLKHQVIEISEALAEALAHLS